VDAGESQFALSVALEAAKAAGRVLLGHYETLELKGVRSKTSRRDLVSLADVEAERTIVAYLRDHLPGHAIEAEEEVQDATQDGRPRWFVDPLDGTINFVQGLPQFCVSLGLFWDGKPQVAVVHAPRLGETFFATRGGGAFLEHSGGRRRLHTSTKQDLADCILATGFPYRREELRPNNLENFSAFFLDVRGVRRMGSAALDLAYVAAGRLDGYWELYLSPYDVAAGALLVLEAGGVVTDSVGADDWLRGGHIVASGPGVHRAIQSRLLGPDPRWKG